ncbi:DUF4197 domain-containing protein [soil metagenome]
MKSTKLFAAVAIFSIMATSAAFGQTRRQTRISDIDISRGLKEALNVGISNAVSQLGQEGGYLDDPRVRIPLPNGLQRMEGTLRILGQGRRVDEFVRAMNKAAEQAVPVAVDVFVDSVRQMSFTDARNILFSGQDDSATQFFRRTSEEKLRVKFRPIVEEMTASVGVTQQYKSLIGRYGVIGKAFGEDASDLDGYVTQKAMDGLFLLIADEERKIRRDPIGRTTSILRIVFGSLR